MNYLKDYRTWRLESIHEAARRNSDKYNKNNATAVEEFLVDCFNVTHYNGWENELRTVEPKTKEARRILGFLQMRNFEQLHLGESLDEKIETTIELCKELAQKIQGNLLMNGGRGIGKPSVSSFWEYHIKMQGGTVNATPKTDIYNDKMRFSVKAPTSQLMSASRAEAIATVNSALSYPEVRNLLSKPFKEKIVGTVGRMEEKLRIIADDVYSVGTAISAGASDNATDAQREIAQQMEHLQVINREIEEDLKKFIDSSAEFESAFLLESASGKVKFLGTDDQPYKGNALCVADHMLIWKFHMSGATQKVHIKPMRIADIHSLIKKVEFFVQFKSHAVKKVVDGKKKQVGFAPYPSLRIRIISQIEDKLQEAYDAIGEWKALYESHADRLDEANILDMLKNGWKRLKDFVGGIISFLKDEVLKPALDMLSKGIHAFIDWFGIEFANASYHVEYVEI